MEHPLLHYVMEHMSVVGNRSEHKYVEKIKSEGAVRLLEPDNCPNGWACPPGDIFKVRGPDYLTTKVKIQAGDYVLKPIGFDWIKGSAKIAEVLKNPNSRVRKVIDDEFQTGDKPFIWAFNLQVPSKDNYSAVAYFVATEPFPEGSLIDQFLKGDDVFRNSRLKLIANIVKGPWIVRKAVGEQAVCIIGRALTCKYCVTENFFEVDVDIGSSVVASAIVHLAFGYITMLTVDIAFLIEGQTESELPEKLLGAFRFSDLNPASAHSFESSSYESSDSLQTSLPTRFWKSLGQGFSQLLHPGAQDSPTAIMAHANGNSKHEDDNEVVKK
ncbi:protein ENHANCED DISEASE RESISTANCE 2 isoform X2 [Mercurialis annua]|nr:protein ENHANCED DISEASE RESISTANCE 2 isoform X2 [Mercurialis annua]